MAIHMPWFLEFTTTKKKKMHYGDGLDFDIFFYMMNFQILKGLYRINELIGLTWKLEDKNLKGTPGNLSNNNWRFRYEMYYCSSK